MAFEIRTITAFVSKDENGEEGLLGMMDPTTGTWIPMVCADEKRVQSLYPMAVEASKLSGLPLSVLQFSVRTDITEQVKQQYGE